MEQAKQTVLQIVISKPRPGVTDSQMTASADAIMPILRQSTDFIHREFRKTDQGDWADCLWWTSLEAGNEVGIKVHSSAEGQAMFGLIEESFSLYNCLPGKVY